MPKAHYKPAPDSPGPNAISPRAAHTIVAALLLIHFALAFFSASGKSLTYDEHAHLPAGIAYLHKRDFRLNPEHPPLSKIIAAFPTLFMKLTWDDLNPYWVEAGRWIEESKARGIRDDNKDLLYRSLNHEWAFGLTFLYDMNREKLRAIFLASRVAMILVSMLTGWIIYRWGSRAFGIPSGLLALAFFTFSPDFLGHGALATTDVTFACFVTFTLWRFDRLLEDWKEAKKSAVNGVWLSLSLAAAMLTKYSAGFLIGFLFFALSLRAMQYPRETRFRSFAIQASALAACALGCGIAMLAFYFMLFGEFVYPMGFRIVSEKLLFNPNVHFYLMGESAKHFPTYFLFAWLFKMTLPVIGLTLLALVLIPRAGSATRSATLLLLWSFGLIFLSLISYAYPQLGVRYMLPLWPVNFLLLGWAHSAFSKLKIWRIAVPIALVWHIVASLIAYPNYVAYMNELTISKGKVHYLTDSNLDWGQDLPALEQYLSNNKIERCSTLLFSIADFSYYGVKFDPIKPEEFATAPPGTYAAVSVFQYQMLSEEDRRALEAWKLKVVLNETIRVYER